MLFNYYRMQEKPYPLNKDGFFDGNFRAEWLRNLESSHFKFFENAPKEAWLRETPRLNSIDKCIALEGFVKSMLHTDWQNLDLHAEHLTDYFNNEPNAATAIWNILNMIKNVDTYPKNSVARLSLFAAYSVCLKEVLSIPGVDIETCVNALHNNPLLGDKNFYSKRSSDLESLEDTLHELDSFLDDLLRLRETLQNPSLLDVVFYRMASNHPRDDSFTFLLNQPWCNTELLYKELRIFTDSNMLATLDIIDRSLSVNAVGAIHYAQLRTHALKDWWGQYPSRNPDDIGKHELHSILDMLKLVAGQPLDFMGEASFSLLLNYSSDLSMERLTEAASLFAPFWNEAQTLTIFEKWAPKVQPNKIAFFGAHQMTPLLNALSSLGAAWAGHFLTNHSTKELLWQSVPIETQRWYATHFPMEYQKAYSTSPPPDHVLMDPILGPWCIEHLPLCSTPEFFEKKVLDWVQAWHSSFDLFSKEMMAVQTLLRPKDIDLSERLHDVQVQYPGEHYKGLIFEALAPGIGLGRWKALSCLETTDKEGSYAPSFFLRPLIKQSIGDIAHVAFSSNTASHIMDSFEFTLN